MDKPSAQPRPPSLTELVALAEAAGEGSEGVRAVLEVIRNRSRARKMPMDKIVSQPHQFSGFDRPDLLEFYNQQPEPLRKEVSGMIAEMEAEDYPSQMGPDIQHYVTQRLWDRRYEHGSPKWLQKMEPAFTQGNHVFLKEPKRVMRRAK